MLNVEKVIDYVAFEPVRHELKVENGYEPFIYVV